MHISNFDFCVVDPRNDDAQLLEAIYRLRYQVYVNEWGFEKPEDHPDGLEKDLHDAHSKHFYACADSGREVIGTARMILPSSAPFPIEEHFDIVYAKPGGKVAEISRLAISKDFRRRAIDRVIFNKDMTHIEDLARHEESLANVENERRKCEHELVRGIYLMIYRESVRIGLTHWYAVMARGLYVMLARWGIHFVQIGAEREYHGIRAPYVLSIRELEDSLQKKNPELLTLARQGFV